MPGTSSTRTPSNCAAARLAATMEPPLGSGPYQVGRVSAGAFIEYERVEDHWAKDLGTSRGLDHFQTHLQLRQADNPWYMRLAHMASATA